MDNKDFIERVLAWRGIEKKEDVCPKCDGSGKRTYGNTTTYMGGMGGQCLTNDVCNGCWGTGDITKKGVNLKDLRYHSPKYREGETILVRDNEEDKWEEKVFYSYRKDDKVCVVSSISIYKFNKKK